MVMIQQTSSLMCPARGKGPVRKKNSVGSHQWRVNINSLFVPEREAQIKTEKKNLSSRLLPCGFFNMDYGNIKIFSVSYLFHTWSNRSWTVHQFRDLVVTGQAPPGRQMQYWDGLHHDLQRARHGEGMRGKLGWLSSAMSSPTWLKTAWQMKKAEDAKSCRNKNNYVPFKELLELDKTQLWNSHGFSELGQMHTDR